MCFCLTSFHSNIYSSDVNYKPQLNREGLRVFPFVIQPSRKDVQHRAEKYFFPQFSDAMLAREVKNYLSTYPSMGREEKCATQGKKLLCPPQKKKAIKLNIMSYQ